MTTAAEFGGEVEGAHVRDLTPPPIHDPEQDAPPLPIAQIKRYQGLHDEVTRLEAELREVKKHKADLEQQLIEAFVDADVPSLTVGGRNVHLHRTIHANKLPGVETADVVAALRAIGKEELITKDTVQAQTLSAYVRELVKANTDLPPELAKVVTKFEKIEIRVNAGRAAS